MVRSAEQDGAETGRPSPLISVAELSARLESSAAVVLLDVRWQADGPHGRAEYRAGHLPGARYLDLDTELCGPPSPPQRRPIPDAARFTATMRRHHVRAGCPVVVYDGGDGTAAARAWWLLRYFGHADVRLLDGGYAAWRSAGRPWSTGEPADGTPPAGTFVAGPGQLPVVDAVGAARIAAGGVLLDARPAGRYLGTATRHGQPAGHIPGAVSASALDDITDTGLFPTVAILRDRYHRLGIGPTTPVGAYCGSGILACRTVLALDLIGVPSALYPGSWSDWISDPDREIATG